MRIAVTYGPMCLLRSADETWADPRTGSEIGWVRIVEGLSELGHSVQRGHHPSREWPEAVIAINEPDELRMYEPGTYGYFPPKRICMFWLNEFSFCKEGFDSHVDYYFSPSEAHRQQAIGPWKAPRPEKWHVNRLGCDLLEATPKESGLCVYCSSPDRGLHRVLEAWPAIKRAAPHARLKIFYRLEPWLRGFDETPYYPPIERNRARALYVEEALRRLSGPEWGIEVVDSVSRDQLQRELQRAEVFLHPCDALSWSEGFSCSTMEACAAGCAVVVSDCDALGQIYAPVEPFRAGDWETFTERTIRLLRNHDERAELQASARKLAAEHTWKAHVSRLNDFLQPHS